MTNNERIYLSPPHMSGMELPLVQETFTSNWIAPFGPNLTTFEQTFGEYVSAPYAVALVSGTAAIHLALLVCGIQARDEVIVSTLTFSGSVNPIIYTGAVPIFLDSDADSWNMSPALLEEFLRKRAKAGRLPKAVIPVHLYGQSADMSTILDLCEHYGVIVIEDAAEALGSRYKNKHPGTLSKMGIFSFNGNKIITTSGGGMLVSDDNQLINHARKLSTQAREPLAYYEHHELGYNYRMSNILAAIGLGQMTVLDERVRRKREIYSYYRAHLKDVTGITFVDEMPYGLHTRWLTVVLIDSAVFGADREQIRLKLEEHNIESRPVWKPMHCQPVFSEYEYFGGQVSETLFEQGLCLPSGTALTTSELDRIIRIIREIHQP